MGKLVELTFDAATTAKLSKGFKLFPAIFKAELGKAVVKLVLIIERKAKQLCPVGKTRRGIPGGTLRNSITPVVVGWAQGFVGTNTHYAPYVEYGTTHGTTKIPARPFLEPAYLEGAKQAPAIFEAALKRALAKAKLA